MSRVRIAQALVTVGVAVGAAVALASPALADPEQFCIVYDDDRSAYCVQIDVPPLAGNRTLQ